MILTSIRDKNFRQEWLDAIKFDPVHPESATSARRLAQDRDVFFLVEDNIPTFVLCVAYTDFLPNTMEHLLESTDQADGKQSKFAIFYSVFKTPVEIGMAVNGSGADIILLAAEYIKIQHPNIKYFTTMSPVPTLMKQFAYPPCDFEIVEYLLAKRDPVARFHFNNGAELIRVIRNADQSNIRQEQSQGIMVNYDYTPIIQNF